MPVAILYGKLCSQDTGTAVDIKLKFLVFCLYDFTVLVPHLYNLIPSYLLTRTNRFDLSLWLAWLAIPTPTLVGRLGISFSLFEFTHIQSPRTACLLHLA